MIRQILFPTVLLLASSLIYASDELKASAYNLCTVEGNPIQLGFYAPNWTAFAGADEKTLKFPAEGAEKIEGKGERRIGTFDVGVYGSFAYSETKLNSKNSVDAEFKITSEKGINTEAVFFQFTLPSDDLNGRPILIDGKEHQIGASLSNWRTQTAQGRHSVKIPMQRGILSINAECAVLLQDNRKFNRNSFSVRLIFPGVPGRLTESAMKVKAEYLPFPVNCVALDKSKTEKAFAGIPFISGTPQKASSLNITLTGQPDYLYILSSRTEKETAKITMEYSDNSRGEITLTAKRDGELFFDPEKQDKVISFPSDTKNKLYLSRLKLAGKEIKTISFSGSDKWMISGISSSKDALIPSLEEEKYIVKAGQDWIPYQGELEIEENSALDFSKLLDAPAGKYGFVTRKGADFVFAEKQDKAIRFWGTNLTGEVLFMNNEDIDRLIKRIAMCGYNLVRIHHFDERLTEKSAKSTDIDPARIDRLDYFIAACKKRGIYISLDLFTSRKIKKGEISEFPDKEITMRDYKSLLMLSESAMLNLEAFSKNMLTHKNSYTGLSWAEEPAIANISLINEGVLYNNIRSDFVHKAFQKAYEEYLKTKPGSDKGVFMHEVYAKGYKRISEIVRSLGVKVPLTDLNYTLDHMDTYFDRLNLDYVDIHYYWAHPDKLGVPRSFNGESAMSSYGGLSILFGARLLDRPFAVTEWSYVFPNAYRSEGGFLAGAYFSLQGYDMPCRFNYTSSANRAMNPTIIIGFEQVSDPVSILSDRAGALFYLRNDVQESKESCAILVRDEKTSIPPETQALGMIFKTGSVFSVEEAAKASSVITLGESEKSLTNPQISTQETRSILKSMQAKGILPENSYNAQEQKFMSSTGELFFDAKNRTFMALTPRSEAFVADSGSRMEGKFANIEISDSFSSVLIASLNDSNLTQSRRMLLLHLTDCQNSEMTFSDSKRDTVENYGKLPVLLRRSEVKFELKAPVAGTPELYALALSGKRLEQIPVEQKDGKLFFRLDNSRGTFAYELLID